MFTGLRYYYLNLHSGSSLREAFIICLNFQWSQYKNEKKKTTLEAEVIKLIVKPTLKELWGAESHVTFFFFLGVFLLLLSFKWFQRLFKGKVSAVPALRSKSEQSCGIFHLEFLAQTPWAQVLCLKTCHTLGYPSVSRMVLCLIISLFLSGLKAKIVNISLFWSCFFQRKLKTGLSPFMFSNHRSKILLWPPPFAYSAIGFAK